MKTSMPAIPLRSSRRNGASTVEMALISPVLFAIVFGLFEIAYGYMVHHLIQDAARQGCRVAVCYGESNTDVNSKINSLLQAEQISGSTTKIMVNSSVADVASAKSGDQITVQITIPASKVSFFPATGYLRGQLTALCTMRHQ
ncbi:MAG: TadE family protein [Schlesneria sp.]|jgi:Flp pilus assembly protein TadG|nr:TadE family protein [Schlesneria sp.]